MSKRNNLKACVEERSHLALDPKPVYIDNDLGYKALRELGEPIKQRRTPSTLNVEDISNRSGERAKGGY